MEIRLPNLRQGYHDLLTTIRESGSHVVSRGLDTRELTGVTLRFADPTQPMLPVGCGRGVNPRLAAVEALQLVGGVDARDALLRATPRYGDVMIDPEDMAYGAYGPRVANQLPEVVHQLRHAPGTRQAVLTIWREEDLTHRGDKPCTLSLQFLVRDGRLQLHTTMRSQDVWLGVPYDVFMFTQLQLTVARLCDVLPGAYVHHVSSLHMYERDVAASHRVHDPTEDADLPRGVVPVHGVEATMQQIRQLVRNVSLPPLDEDWAEANAWYVDQIREVFATESSYLESISERS